MDAEYNREVGIETVAVVGAGTIGASWTALFLAAGYNVDVYDPAETAEAYVTDYIATAWPSLVELGIADSEAPLAASFYDRPEEAVEGAQFVQESVPERLDVKHEIFARIEPHLEPAAIVASSASGLLVRDMQDGFRDPSRFLLAHPFNPPHLIPLVELLGNARTDPAALDAAERFYRGCGKVTIRLAKEVPGHVANRLQAALWREAVHLVAEGVASVEDVDLSISAGPGLRWSVMGPHMLFSLAAGGAGMETFCARYGPSFHRWWDDLGAPQVTPELARQLAEGVREEEAGRDFATLAAERDRKIVAVLKALASAGKGS